MSAQPNAKLPDGCSYDSYGQVQLTPKWYNPFTWAIRHKYTAYGAVAAGISVYVNSFLNRRPIYANLSISLPSFILITGGAYLYGKHVAENRMRLRDQTINHYISLHPDDFEAVRTKGRQYRDILLPWVPFRGYENPIAWSSGKKPYYLFVPDETNISAAGASHS